MPECTALMLTKVHLNTFLLPSLGQSIIQSHALARESIHLVVLNSASLPWSLLASLWACSMLKICADGGANRLFHGTAAAEIHSFIPQYIVGDLDSAEPHVLEYYRSQGACVIKETCQDTNDLDKSLSLLQTQLNAQDPNSCRKHSVLILGALGGRFDHEIANIHALYKWKDVFGRLQLLDHSCSVTLLEPGICHRILPMRSNTSDDGPKVMEGRYCGLLPLAQPVDSVRTKGLQWDLTAEPLALGSRISSSNTIPAGSEEVVIETSSPLLWTCSYELFA